MLGLMRWQIPEGIEPLDHFTNLMLGLNEDAICSSRFGPFTTIWLFEPKYIKFVFEDRFDDFVKGKDVRDRLFELLGDGIFASDGMK